jgi:replicative DNA helicase
MLDLQFDSPLQLPPQNIEAEESILGGILLDPNAYGRISDVLCAAHFYIEAHQLIFDAMNFLKSQCQPTDLISVAARLSDTDTLSKIGGQAKLVQLVDRTVSAVNIDRYAALVIDKWCRRNLIGKLQDSEMLAYDTAKPFPEIAAAVQTKILDATCQSPEASGDWMVDVVVDVMDLVSARAIAAEEAERRGENYTVGTATGLVDFDNLTEGMVRGDLMIIAGRPSMGKTTLAQQFVNVGSSSTAATAIFSLEMSRLQLGMRAMSAQAGIDSTKLRRGDLSHDQWSDLGNTVETLGGQNIYIDDRSSITVGEIGLTCRRLKAERGLSVVMIDYAQLLINHNERANSELSQISRSLKLLARELDICVILVSQLNRGVESRQDKRPLMSDLKESGALEQDADVVVMLYRDEYYNPDTPDRGITELWVRKNRNGSTGMVKLLFASQQNKFVSLQR